MIGGALLEGLVAFRVSRYRQAHALNSGEVWLFAGAMWAAMARLEVIERVATRA
jgi:hypothetical protein